MFRRFSFRFKSFNNQWKPNWSFLRARRHIAWAITIPFMTTRDDEGQIIPMEIPNKYLYIFGLLSISTGFGYKMYETYNVPNPPEISIKSLNGNDGFIDITIKNDGIIGHRIEYVDDVNAEWQTIDINDDDNDCINYSIGPLTANRNYSIRCKSKNTFGFGTTSKILQIKTMDKFDRNAAKKRLLQLEAEINYHQLSNNKTRLNELEREYNALKSKLQDKSMKLLVIDAEFDTDKLSKPPTINIKSVHDEGCVTINITNISNNDIIAHKLEYAEIVDGDDSNIKWKAIDIDTEQENMEYTISALKSDAYYMIRATSKNSYGYGSNSEIVKIKTIDWSRTTLLNLNGGTGGKANQTTYIAPNTIVECSLPTHGVPGHFMMSQLFNGDLTSDTRWLAFGYNVNNATLSFTFDSIQHVSHINVCATTSSSQWERFNYSIDALTMDNKWIKVCDMVHTKGDRLGCIRRHDVRKTVSKIRLNIHKTDNQKNNIGLKEVDIYVATF